MRDLSGKVALVTGATSGIGLETALALAGRGAHVILGARNLKLAAQVAASIRKDHPDAKVDVGPTLDLLQPDTIDVFAAAIDANYPTLDILVNNAGVSFMKKVFTADGVGGIAQTNHLGAYKLTRLLEKKLVASKARIVTVSSVTHRIVTIRDVTAFLKEWRSGFYFNTKLANVLFAYELQRRLGARGVTSCAADPGGSGPASGTPAPCSGRACTGVYARGMHVSSWWLVDNCYSPPKDGATSIIHAATVPWAQDRAVIDGTPVVPGSDLRYYARGLFTSPILCKLDGMRGKGWGFKQNCVGTFWGVTAVVYGFLDWPVRSLSSFKLASQTKAVRSSTQSYDQKLATELWDVSADVAKLPRALTV
ncbi:MAG: hypothetical protein WDW36_009623 [Sanguina aurantia]